MLNDKPLPKFKQNFKLLIKFYSISKLHTNFNTFFFQSYSHLLQDDRGENMSIKITLVENHINRNFKQYNIDDFTIKENFGSIENFKTILSKKRSKEDEANLIAFLNEIRPINKIIDMRKNNYRTTIHKGYISSSN